MLQIVYVRLALAASGFLAVASAVAAGAQDPAHTLDINQYPPKPQTTICGDINNEYFYESMDSVMYHALQLLLTIGQMNPSSSRIELSNV